MPSRSSNSRPQEGRLSPRTDVAETCAASPSQQYVFYADILGAFRACNAALSTLLGSTPKELAGRDVSSIFQPKGKSSPDEQALLREAILAAASTPEGYQAPLFARTKSGDSLPVRLCATILRDSSL